jgi:hypothetical protein
MHTKKHLYYLSALLMMLFFSNCNNTTKTGKTYVNITESYKYPMDSITINRWIKNNNFKAMYKHSWNVWEHLTAPLENGKLRYQTWSSPAQILEKLNNTPKNEKKGLLFKKPSQFGHAKAKQKIFDDTDMVEVVAYNKAAEQFAIDNKIFYLSSLKSMQKGAYSKIPEFPSKTITIKPVYKVITKNKLSDGIYTMAAWNGPEYKKGGFPEKDWGSCIHVNTSENNDKNPSGTLHYNCNDRTTENTYFLNDFIHFKITKEQAVSYNKEIKGDIEQKSISTSEKKKLLQESLSEEGDVALLVGMHVATKEIKRWVWQTYWWSPTPLTPATPSSNDIASSRNGIKLQGAANHYAMGVVYSMLIPAQPYEGGKSEGELVVAFNPYLESGFGEGTFSGSTSYVYNNGNKIKTDLGVTTNCMTCHMAAAQDVTNYDSKYNGIYFGDSYISYKNPLFKDKLMFDFAWSVQANIDANK